MTTLFLNDKIIASNEGNRSAIVNLTSEGSLDFTNLSPYSPANRFLLNRSHATSQSINRLALTSSALQPTGTAPELDTAFAIMSTSSAVFHCVEQVLWINALCNLCHGGSGGSGDSVVVAFVFGILATLILGIFGSSLGSAILSSMKIHSASKEITRLQHSKKDIIHTLASFRVDDQEGARSKAAALISVEANKELISAYKNYRASKIAFLVCAIICSIALLALAAGTILGIFFSGPLAAAAISAAIIGCCAGGGGLILIGLISFMIASVYMAKKQEAAVLHLNSATLYSMVADQILNNPDEYDRNTISQTVTQQVVVNYPQRLFNQMERAYLNVGRFPRGTGGGYSPPSPSAPPPYSDNPPPYAEFPPSYAEATRSGSN
ncbi:inclusion membrane protein GarD [Chlamydia sp. 04-14]|uniref:inclusion membrane protein GarD n=1 Tax=Chlamydia TaxID=810 RepID=UPI002FC87814